MNNIKRVGLVIKPHAPKIEQILKELTAYFKKRNIACVLEEVAARRLRRNLWVRREEVPGQVDLLVVLGGDGTLLSIAHLAAVKNVPVMGVNLGSLGFLTEVPLEEMYLTLDSYLSGNEAIISPRRMLEARVKEKVYYCLNDVVINKGALARMIQFTIWSDDEEIATLKADGLIISTPTGSTAYSLSAGGPIIQPYIPAVLISPICPHALSFRPMVLSNDAKIKVRLLTPGEEVYLTIDGQRGNSLVKDDVVVVKRAPLELKLISSPKRCYFDLLHDKLGWG